MNINNKYLLFAVGMISASVYADEPTDIRPFVGFKGGWQLADDNAYQHTDPSNYLLGVYGGLQLTPSWSWDVGYQYHGKLKADATQVSVKTALIESAVRYDWLVSDSVNLYGRLGAAYWDMQKSFDLTLDEKGFSPLGELGVSYQVSSNVFFNAGYQYIHSIGNTQIGEYDSHSIMTGISYRFGGQEEQVVIPDVVVVPVEPLKEELIIQESITIIEVMPSSLLSSVVFGFDSFSSNQEVTPAITDVLLMLTLYPQARIDVIGYSDPSGSVSYNQALSEKRAQQVAQILENNGIDTSRMDVRGDGEVELAPDASLEEHAKARRVDIQLQSFEYEVIK